ncbi:MAG: YlxR family protein [Coriobacteriia bacterium]|nr:YlxR family protein [Coriobacteriia bacterium]MBN2840045.1 YlxR family protein [Coriobacteriia bacterium]
MTQRPTPQRTCVACRRVDDKRSFVRLVRDAEGDVHVDPSGKAPGRGASVCASIACFESAVTKNRFASALRASLGEEDVERLRHEFEDVLQTRGASAPGTGR